MADGPDKPRNRPRTLRRELLANRRRRVQPEELGEVIALLGDANRPLQRAAGDALVRTGKGALPQVARALELADPAVRRSATYVLGELLRRAPGAAGREALERALQDADPKVRKNAAIALGKLADPATIAALQRQLHDETVEYVRPSIVLALGEVGGPRAHAALAGYRPATDDEARALWLAREHSDPEPPVPIRLDAPVDGPLDLRCRAGAELILEEELRAAGLRYERGAGYVRLAWRFPLSELFRVRCFDSIALPIAPMPHNPLDAPHEVADAFIRSPAMDLAVRLTEPRSPLSVPYRVTFQVPRGTGLRHRDWIAAFGARLRAANAAFVNSPARYSWEFLVRYERHAWYLGMQPTAYRDPRFAYREMDVPAALNPAVAAAMARLVPAGADEAIVDPFCGSGTLLVECARRGPRRALVGIDREDRALAAARHNTAAAGIARSVTLLRGDARQLGGVLARGSIGQVDAIVTNPPYGVRVGSSASIAELYPAFLHQAAAVVKPHGHLVMLAKEGRMAAAAAERHGFAVEQRRQIDTGGILVWLFVFRRR